MATIPLYVYGRADTDFLITEKYEQKQSDGSSRIVLVGKIQEADKANRNGRIYPRKLWEKVLSENSSFKTLLKERKVLGQLEHPEKGISSLKEVSHLVEDVWMDPATGAVYGRFLVLDTPSGKIVKELVSAGIPVGVSSRAMGSVKRSPDGYDIVQEDGFELKTFDFVCEPSVVDAYPSYIKEALENLCKQKETNMSDIKNDIKLISECERFLDSVGSDFASSKEILEKLDIVDSYISKLASVDQSLRSDADICIGKLLAVKSMLKKSLIESSTESNVPVVEAKPVSNKEGDAKVVSKVVEELLTELRREKKEAESKESKVAKEESEKESEVKEPEVAKEEPGKEDEVKEPEVAKEESRKEDEVKEPEVAKEEPGKEDEVKEPEVAKEEPKKEDELSSDEKEEVPVVKDKFEEPIEFRRRLLRHRRIRPRRFYRLPYSSEDRSDGETADVFDKSAEIIDVAAEAIDKAADVIDNSAERIANLSELASYQRDCLRSANQFICALVERGREIKKELFVYKFLEARPDLKGLREELNNCRTVVECKDLLHNKYKIPLNEMEFDSKKKEKEILESSTESRKGFVHFLAKRL